MPSRRMAPRRPSTTRPPSSATIGSSSRPTRWKPGSTPAASRPEEWMGYIRRTVLRQRWADDLADIVAEHPVDDCRARGGPPDRPALLRHPSHPRRGTRRRGRGARRPPSPPRAPAPRPTATRPRGPSRPGRALPPSTPWRPRRIAREVASNQMEWIRVDCQAIGFPEEGPAREAALCLREDELDIEEVAGEADVPIEEVVVLPRPARPASSIPAFSAPTVDDVIGPVPVDEAYTRLSGGGQGDALHRGSGDRAARGGGSPRAAARRRGQPAGALACGLLGATAGPMRPTWSFRGSRSCPTCPPMCATSWSAASSPPPSASARSWCGRAIPPTRSTCSCPAAPAWSSGATTATRSPSAPCAPATPSARAASSIAASIPPPSAPAGKWRCCASIARCSMRCLRRRPEVREFFDLQARHRHLQHFFRQFTDLAKLPPEALGALLRELEPVEVDKGEVLFSEGDPPGPMYIIEEGRCRVHIGIGARRRNVAFLRRGRVLRRAQSSSRARPRESSVEAVTPCRLLRLTPRELRSRSSSSTPSSRRSSRRGSSSTTSSTPPRSPSTSSASCSRPTPASARW